MVQIDEGGERLVVAWRRGGRPLIVFLVAFGLLAAIVFARAGLLALTPAGTLWVVALLVARATEPITLTVDRTAGFLTIAYHGVLGPGQRRVERPLAGFHGMILEVHNVGPPRGAYTRLGATWADGEPKWLTGLQRGYDRRDELDEIMLALNRFLAVGRRTSARHG